MRTRQLGTTPVSTVGLGCNNFGRRLDEAGSAAVVRAALDVGITHFDTANTYGYGASEEYLGRALGADRDQAVIVTKFGSVMDDGRGGAAPDYARESVVESLRRLGTDYVDVCMVHFPDDTVPIAETLGALGDLVSEGLVRDIGCSNFSVTQLRGARATDEHLPRFGVVQDEYSLVHRQPEVDLIPDCVESGTAFVPFFPLGAGVLTGKYRIGAPPPDGSRLATPGPRTETLLAEQRLLVAGRLESIADAAGLPLSVLAIAWLLERPQVVSVIAGASTVAQVVHNAAAADVDLDPELVDQLDEASNVSDDR